MSASAADLRDVAVMGGGCYGTFYARQLASARDKAGLRFQSVLIVDRDPTCQATREAPLGAAIRMVHSDWSEFLDRFLDEPADESGRDDAIVPSPLMPHLMASWLERAARRRWPNRVVQPVAARTPMETPYDRLASDGTRYVSFADWLCPTHCIEPHLCPVTRGPRTWEMGDAVAAYAGRLAPGRPAVGTAVFTTRHRAYGVGMFGGAEARAALGVLEGLPPDDTTQHLVVATISACHGALTVLELGPEKATP